MSETKDKKEVHQGTNVRLARITRGINQQELADKLNKQQRDISVIEGQSNIEDELLKQISLALDVPLEFLQGFSLGTATSTYIGSISSQDNGSSTGIMEVAHDVNYFPLDKVSELYERLLDQQKETIAKLEKRITELEK